MDLTIFPYSFTSADIDGSLNIHIWGVDRNSDSYLCRITNFPAYCYLELPTHIKLDDTTIIQQILNVIYYHIPNLVNYTVDALHKLYYYNPVPTNFLLLAFKSFSSLSILNSLIKNNNGLLLSDGTKVAVKIYEYDVSVVRKFLTFVGLNYSQWFQVTGSAVQATDKISTLNNEYIIDVKTLTPIPESTSISWIIAPKIMFVSFDISNKIITGITAILTTMSPVAHTDTFTFTLNDNNGTNITASTDIALINNLWDYIKNYDPDIVVGYEILSSFYNYVHKKIKNENLPNLSRLVKGHSSITHTTWKSSAFGYNDVYTLQMEGRIHLDLYYFAKRNLKLKNYRLNTVLEKYDITPVDNIKEVGANKANDIINLFYKSDAWLESIELSSIVATSIEDLFIKGEQVRLFSIIYDTAVRNGYVIDYAVQPDIEVQGGFVSDVVPGIYDDTIWLDFARLYPSLIIANNICYTTQIESDVKLPESDVNIIVGTNKGGVFQTKYVRPHVRKGILPMILMQKISERNLTSAAISESKNDLVINKLKRREIILKRTTNAFYGFLSINDDKGVLSLINAAITITYLARSLTESINDKISLEYSGNILYNDTDSIVFNIPGLPTDRLYSTAMDIVTALNLDFPDPIRIAFDRTGRFILIKAKKYAVLEYDKDGNPTNNIVKKGLLVGRSDACEFVEDVYGQLLDDILLKHSINIAFENILNSVISLTNHKIPDYKLGITKKINTKYSKDSTYFLKTFLDRLAAIGIKIALGTDVEYVVTGTGTTDIGSKMELLELLTSQTVINYEYYISNVLSGQIDDLWKIGYADKLGVLEGITYKPPGSRKRKIPSLLEPVQIILLQYIARLRLEDLKTWIGKYFK
jgi:DNA polymerase elongation subunit (family B)